MNYDEFLNSKLKTVHKSGFEISQDRLNPDLFPFQKFIVQRALLKGKFAIWADCGLGKTIMQLEWANQVFAETFKPVLILCPFAVAGQTIEEGEKFGIKVTRFPSGDPVEITNYEQLDNVDASQFGGVVLDESSILKNFAGAIRNKIIEKFKKTPYKLACTATPSPNDPIEIGNHSEFLDVLPSVEMVSRFFTVDHKNKSNKYKLKGHAVKDFYRWISTWAIMISKPSDIGFEDTGYDLPALNIHDKVIQTPPPPGQLFNTARVSATDYHADLRVTMVPRLEAVAEIVNNSSENFIIWTRQDEEGKRLRKMIPDAVEVKGSDKAKDKESRLLGFAKNEFRVLITKPKIAQFGLNYQNCRNQIFVAPDFSFEGTYQAIRRSWRFGQDREVNIYIVSTDTLSNVIASIRRKQKQFITMKENMKNAINEAMKTAEGTASISDFTKGNSWELYHGDSFKIIPTLPENSVDGMVFSPPFSKLYGYSASPADLSNCIDDDQFFKHFSFMVPELLRILKPGRMCGIHLMQLTTMMGEHGFYSIVDFRGDIIRLFQKFGFIFHAEVTIFKRPDLAAVRTKNHQLLHKSTKKDSLVCRPGLADYLVIFRKPGENAVPVNHDGNGIPFDDWVKIASPVWMDVMETDTLSTASSKAKEDERHITPTQLPVIERFNILYTNPGEVVFSPFMGIGSEGYQSVLQGRHFIGIELKESYFKAAIKNCRTAEELTRQLAADF